MQLHTVALPTIPAADPKTMYLGYLQPYLTESQHRLLRIQLVIYVLDCTEMCEVDVRLKEAKAWMHSRPWLWLPRHTTLFMLIPIRCKRSNLVIYLCIRHLIQVILVSVHCLTLIHDTLHLTFTGCTRGYHSVLARYSSFLSYSRCSRLHPQ